MYVVGKGITIEGPGTSLVQRINWDGRGLGCVGMGCGCGKRGGMGLFDSMDFTTWGVPEWGVLALAGYMLMSSVFTTQRAVTRVGKSVRRYQRRRAVAA